jgi:hypothetical protein
MLELPEIVTIEATQKTSFQIIPNCEYDYKSNKEIKEFSEKPVNKRFEIATKLSLKSKNGNNKKQKPSGLSFNELGFGENIYIIGNNHNIYITNEMKGTKKQMMVSVRYLNDTNVIVQNFIEGARGLARTWEGQDNSAERNVISGTMKHFGIIRGAGDCPYFSYSPTMHNTNDANRWHKKVNTAAKLIAEQLFPDTLNSIQSTMDFHDIFIPEIIGGKHGLCSEMVQSQHALVTEPHVDIDSSKCLSIWTVEPGKETRTDGWYFVLPYLTCRFNGKEFNGVAVKLRHGTGIEWDGRFLFHCSTAPNDKRVNVHGTYFGMTRNSM